MPFREIRNAIEAHSGVFVCARLDDETHVKEARFHHKSEPPVESEVDVPPELLPFYRVFGSLTLYYDPVSSEAAFHIGSPAQWEDLDIGLRSWFEDLSEQEVEHLLPQWIDDCITFGEIPSTGNYLLMPLVGDKRGFIIEFEHDGYEFIEQAPDLEQFLRRLLDPSDATVGDMAGHMRFVENDDWSVQWGMTEMRDNRGNRVLV